MANSEEPQTVFQEIPGFHEERSILPSKPVATIGRAGRFLVAVSLSHEWSSAALYLFLDVVSWLAIYRVAGWFRYDAFYATPFQFFVINLIQLGVIVAALYFVGGYDRTVEKLTLGYAAEHILAVTAAALVSAMLIYSAATFDQTMKPSRGVLLLSFAIFLPLSLAYRRWIRQYVVANSVGRSFLVIGGGATAARFYEAYKKSSNGQQLEFVDVNEEHVGQPIAGEGSPVVQGNLASKLDNLSNRYSGIILAESAGSLNTQLLERLVHAQFQETRVYTLESFYETQWRYLPLGIVDPFWPLQTGFQLGAHLTLSLSQTPFRCLCLGNGPGYLFPALCSCSFVHLDERRCSCLIQTGTSRPRWKTFHSFQIPDHALSWSSSGRRYLHARRRSPSDACGAVVAETSAR